MLETAVEKTDPLRAYSPVAGVWSRGTIVMRESLAKKWFQVGENHRGYEI